MGDRAEHPGPDQQVPFMVEVFNIGEWFTHGDYACDVNVDIIGVVEHRLIPAKVRHEWSRLHMDGIHSVWSPASQKHCQVGQAGVGVVSPKLCFCLVTHLCYLSVGRAIGTVFAVREGEVCIWSVHMGIRVPAMIQRLQLKRDFYLTQSFFELAAAAGCQPRLISGNFSAEPNLIPRLQKGIRNRIWVDLEEAWARVAGEGSECHV